MPPKRMVDRSAEHGTKRARQRLISDRAHVSNSQIRVPPPPQRFDHPPSHWRTQHIPPLQVSHALRNKKVMVPGNSSAAERPNSAARGRRSRQTRRQWTLGSADNTILHNLTATANPSDVRPLIKSAATGDLPRPQKEALVEPAARDLHDELAMAALTRLFAAEDFRSGLSVPDVMHTGDCTEADHAIALQIRLHEELESRREFIARDAAFAAQLHAHDQDETLEDFSQSIRHPGATTSRLPSTRAISEDPHFSAATASGGQSSSSQVFPEHTHTGHKRTEKRKRERADNICNNSSTAGKKAEKHSGPLRLAATHEDAQFFSFSPGTAPSAQPSPQAFQDSSHSILERPRDRKTHRAIKKLKTKSYTEERAENFAAPYYGVERANCHFQVVLDTNIILAHLHFLRRLLSLLPPNVQLLVPKAVLTELDVLKTRRQEVQINVGGKAVKQQMGHVARDATNWLLETTQGTQQVIVQRMEEETKEMSLNKNADARILAYALNLARNDREKTVRVALFSNDNLLRLNAHSEGILALSVKDVGHDPVRLLATLAPGTAVRTLLLNELQQPEGLRNGTLASTSSNIHPNLAETHLSGHLNWRACETEVSYPCSPIESFARVKYWPPGRIIARSNLVIASNHLFTGAPDEEFRQYAGMLEVEGRQCQGCGFEGGKTIKTPPALAHYSCATCLEIVCKGCWKVTGCPWDCTAPFDGEACGATACCDSGRALMLYEILCQLDNCFMSNNFRLSLKINPSSRPVIYQGDQALTRFLVAITQLLPSATSQSDNSQTILAPHDPLKSMLLSSTLLEVLCRVLTHDPLNRWPQRSELYRASFNLMQRLCLGFPQARAVLDHRLVKSSTCGLRAVLEENGQILWSRAISANEAIGTRFLSPADVQTILDNRTSEEALEALRNKPIKLALYDVLRELFMLATRKMENFHARSATDQAQIGDSGEIEIVDAILDLATGFVQMFRTDISTNDRILANRSV